MQEIKVNAASTEYGDHIARVWLEDEQGRERSLARVARIAGNKSGSVVSWPSAWSQARVDDVHLFIDGLQIAARIATSFDALGEGELYEGEYA